MIPILPQNSESIQRALLLLKKREIIAHPADTCYGLAGDFLSPEVLQSLQQMKGREEDKPMSVMLPLSRKEVLPDYAKLTAFSTEVCHRLFPGPVTLVLPKGPKVPSWYFPETSWIGLRIPQDTGVQALLEAFAGPLITTSANPSGRAVGQTAQAVAEDFRDQEKLLSLILDSDRPMATHASTVIQVFDSALKILREGPFSREGIEGVIQGLEFKWVV